MSGDELDLDGIEAQANSGFLTHQTALALVAEVRRLRADRDDWKAAWKTLHDRYVGEVAESTG